MDSTSVPYVDIDALRKGALLLKFGRHGTPQFRHFQLTDDMLYLTWQSKRKAVGNSRVLLTDCKLIKGQSSLVFKRHERSDLGHVSFTLEVSGTTLDAKPVRTLDVACKSDVEYQTWTNALAFLCTHGPPSPSKLLLGRKPVHDEAVSANQPSLPSQDSSATSKPNNQNGLRTSRRQRRRATGVQGILRAGMKDTNDIYVWGFGGWGQLGSRSTTEKSSRRNRLSSKRQSLEASEPNEPGIHTEPVLLEGLLGKGILCVSCGDHHTAAIAADGQLFAWGNGGSGRLGLGHSENVLHPVPVPTKHAGEAFLMVACGALHTLAVTRSGQVFAWGCGRDGRLGTGDQRDRLEPVPVPFSAQAEGSVRATCVAAGACSSAAVGRHAAGSSLYTWGAHEHGLLGRPLRPGTVHDLVPGRVDSFTSANGSASAWELQRTAASVTTVSLGSFHGGLLTTACECFTWGWGGCGQLGLGDLEDAARPAQVVALDQKPARSLSCGGAHTAVVVSGQLAGDRTVYTWGAGHAGQLGHGPARSLLRGAEESKDELDGVDGAAWCVPTPQLVCGLRDVAVEVVACGEAHTTAVSEAGEVYVWGKANLENSTAAHKVKTLEMGDVSVFEPVLCESLVGKEVRGVSCGARHTCVTVAKEWIDDKETKACMQCKVNFTFVNRKHHCRNCGGIFCGKCSSKRHAVLKLGHIVPVRVCDSCYGDLGSQQH